jgi:hypothetical protein
MIIDQLTREIAGYDSHRCRCIRMRDNPGGAGGKHDRPEFDHGGRTHQGPGYLGGSRCVSDRSCRALLL